MQFPRVGKIRGMDVIWALDSLYITYLCMLQFMHLSIYELVGLKGKMLHYIFYTNFIFEVINIDFRRFGILMLRVLGGLVRPQLSIILMQTVGRFNM